MMIPRGTAIGIGISAAVTSIGMAVAMAQPMVPETKSPSTERLVAGGISLAAAMSVLGFGLLSPIPGLRPIATAAGALAGAALLGAGGGTLLSNVLHPAPGAAPQG